MSIFSSKKHMDSRPKFIWTLASFSTLFLLVSLLTACAPAMVSTPITDIPVTGELASVLNKGILVIATDASYPPGSELIKDMPRATGTHCDLTQYSANQLKGFDIDVAIEIARRLGVEPCFVTPTWSQIISGNWSDRWSVDVGSMVITPDRMQKLYFTQPYISGEAVIFVHQDNKSYQSPADLSGKRIGVCTGCAYEDYLHGTLVIPGEEIKFEIKNAQVVGYDTDTSALADLAAGDGVRLDAVLTDPDTGKSALNSGLPIKQLDGAVYHDYSAVAIDKNSVDDPIPLVKRISTIIQALHSDGTLKSLSQKYYGGDFTVPAALFDLQTLEQFP